MPDVAAGDFDQCRHFEHNTAPQSAEAPRDGCPSTIGACRSLGPFAQLRKQGLRGRGLERLQAFAEWASQQDKPVVVGGHSLFFRGFFREFLPVGSNPFGARDTKIANGGVVALTLERGTVQGPDGSSVGPICCASVRGGGAPGLCRPRRRRTPSGSLRTRCYYSSAPSRATACWLAGRRPPLPLLHDSAERSDGAVQ